MSGKRKRVDDEELLATFGGSKKKSRGEDDWEGDFSSAEESFSESSSDEEEEMYDERMYKIGDEEDRKRLDSLPEVEREKELSLRYDQRKLAMERREQRQKLKEMKRKKKREEVALRKKRGGKRDKDRERERERESLRRERKEREREKEERERRQKEAKKKKRGKKDEDEDSEMSGEDIEEEDEIDEEEIDEEEEEMDRFEESGSEEDDEDEVDEVEEEDEDDEDDEEGRRGAREAEMEDIKKIFLKRSRIEKWVNEPYFEQVVSGFFVRVVIGMSHNQPRYRLARVVSVKEGRHTYTVRKKSTRQKLRLSLGKAEKDFSIANISNQLFTEGEYSVYLKKMEEDNVKKITKKQVDDTEKKKKIPDSYVHTWEDVDQMINYDSKLKKIPPNISATLTKLREKLMKMKEEEGESGEKEIDEMKSKIEMLEEISSRRFQESLDSRNGDAMKKLNEKNRAANDFVNHEGMADYLTPDIFRRDTRPTSFRNILEYKEGEKKKRETKKKDEAKKGGPGDDEMDLEFFETNKIGTGLKTRPPRNFTRFLTEIHDFDISVDPTLLDTRQSNYLPVPSTFTSRSFDF